MISLWTRVVASGMIEWAQKAISRPVSRESTATNLQLQLSPSKAKQSTTLTLRNSHRRHHLLKALTLDEGSQSDHHENFYEFKVKKKAPPKKITMDPAARKAYLQKQADKQRAIIEAQRQAQLGEALEGQAQLDAASAREEADFEAQMEARIIVLKEERERRMAEVRAGTVTEVQEAFLEGPWRALRSPRVPRPPRWLGTRMEECLLPLGPQAPVAIYAIDTYAHAYLHMFVYLVYTYE